MAETTSGAIDPLDVALGALLEQYPDAPVGALDGDGFLIPLPPSFPAGDRPILAGRSTLELVEPSDRVVIVRAWGRANTAGAARAPVRLCASGQPASVHFFDTRPEHGVFLAVVVPEGDRDEGETLSALTSAPVVAPRLGVVKKNELGVVIEVDDATLQMLGWPADQIVGFWSVEMVHPDDQFRSIDAWMEMLNTPSRPSRWRGRYRRADGSWLWVEITNHNFLDAPDHGYVLGEMVDISDEMAVQEALRAREQLLDRLAQTVPVGLFQFDEHGQVTYRNDRLHVILGTGDAATVDEQLATVLAEERERAVAAVAAVLADGTDQDFDVGLRMPTSGELRECSLSLRALTDDSGRINGAIACITDITDRSRMQNELRHQAMFDALTGCQNRASVMKGLEATLTAPDRTDSSVAVVFVDLDDFKPVNDRYGHAVGDELLKVVADRLGAAVRGDDIVGRLGGDEFIVVCRHLSGVDEALKVAERVSRLLAREVELGTATLAPRASIGVACCRPNQLSADSLVAQADSAMYAAKRRRADHPVLFERMDHPEASPA